MDEDQYSKVKTDAAAQVDAWFTENPRHWQDKAKWIADLCQEWGRTWGDRRVWIHLSGRGGDEWVAMDKCQPDEPEFHPVLYFSTEYKPTVGTIEPDIPTFEDQNKALACYYTCLIILHDFSGQGYQDITAGIWPDPLRNLGRVAFEPLLGDKSRFIEAALRSVGADLQRASRILPEQQTIAPAVRFPNEVPWDDADPAYYPNKEAIDDAHREGTDHEIQELVNLSPNKLYKLLRSPDGYAIHFMSRKNPPRGKVHKDDWNRYLHRQVERKRCTDEAVENEALKLAE